MNAIRLICERADVSPGLERMPLVNKRRKMNRDLLSEATTDMGSQLEKWLDKMDPPSLGFNRVSGKINPLRRSSAPSRSFIKPAPPPPSKTSDVKPPTLLLLTTHSMSISSKGRKMSKHVSHFKVKKTCRSDATHRSFRLQTRQAQRDIYEKQKPFVGCSIYALTKSDTLCLKQLRVDVNF